MNRILALTSGFLLAAIAWAGPITSESYASAYAQGVGLIFPLTSGGALSGSTASFNFTGVETFVNGTLSTVAEGCAPTLPAGNGVTGCSATRPAPSVYTLGTNSTTGTNTIDNSAGSQSYQGTSFSSAAGVNETGTMSVSLTSSTAGQSGYLNDYATGNEAFTVAPDATHLAGSTGTMILDYTITPPAVTGSATGANAVWYGEWKYRSWLSTGTTTTDQFQQGGVDLAALSGVTVVPVTVSFVFGSASIVNVGYDLGMGWTATGTGPVSASASFDPLQTLTGITIEDSSSTVIPIFSLSDSNGNTFGPSGLASPEPSSYLLAATGLSLAFAARRIRPQAR